MYLLWPNAELRSCLRIGLGRLDVTPTMASPPVVSDPLQLLFRRSSKLTALYVQNHENQLPTRHLCFC